MCLHVDNTIIIISLTCIAVGGEESLELSKARGDLLGERAMAEAVG